MDKRTGFVRRYRALVDGRRYQASRIYEASRALASGLRELFRVRDSREMERVGELLTESSSTPRNVLSLEWACVGAIATVDTLVAEAGEPLVVGSDMVRWRNVLGFVEVEVRDEAVVHVEPSPHVDCLYTTLEIGIPQARRRDVLRLSDTLVYDPLKKWLRARCHSMPANCVILALARSVAAGDLSVREARNRYGRLVQRVYRDVEALDSVKRYLFAGE